MIASASTYDYPSKVVLLNEKTLINTHPTGVELDFFQLPNVTKNYTLALDRELFDIQGVYANNASSYYFNTNNNGLYFFKNVTNKVPTFNFG